jgi:serine/threonine-protein kinase
MRICPKCRTAYPKSGVSTCAKDGMKLVDAQEFAKAQADPLLGTKLEGRYEIVERIGTGGMGTVYRAKQEPLGRHVALKILKKELNWDSDTVTRFHREAKAMSLLTHPNTVRVFDFGKTKDDTLFFAMELLEGELLTAKVDREAALDPVDAIRIAQQILRSLSEAHSKGIIHRDLKPDNIYLAQVEGSEASVVKVLDFGIAKVVELERRIDQLETQAGTVFGTPRYMSPEQAQGKKLDARSDLYSVGVLLYHMLTGSAPFVDDDAVVVMAKHIREKPTPVRVAAPDRPIPGSLERVVMRMIEKDPSRRYKTADRLDRRLETCIGDVILEKRARQTGGRRSLGLLLGDIPRVPVLAGLGLVSFALAVATYVIVSSDEAGADTIVNDILDVGNPPTSATVDESGYDLVRLDSVPTGAEVWFDGAQLGETPLEVRRPPGSRMQVELRKADFLTAHAEVAAGGELWVVELRPDREGAVAEASGDAPSNQRNRRNRRRRNMRRQETATETATETMSADTETPAMMDDPYERWD